MLDVFRTVLTSLDKLPVHLISQVYHYIPFRNTGSTKYIILCLTGYGFHIS